MPPSSNPSIKFNEFKFNTAPFNAWSYSSAPTNIASIIRSTIKYPFRKVEIKRRQSSNAQYESSWLDITNYVEKYGSIQTAIDSTRVNQFLHSGVNLTVRNDYGQFNPEWDGQSLFFGYLTRVRTQVRISAGYTDGSGNQFPDDPIQGIFVLTGEINIASSNNQVNLNCKSLASIFQEVRADELDGITNSITSSQIVTLIRDATDGSGNLLFRTFITSTAWDIQTTSTIISNLGTTTSLEEYSVWELMVKLAEMERFVVHISNSGGLVFGDRSPNTTDPNFHLYGAGYRDPNIIKITNYKEAVDKLYTHTIFKFLEEDTDSSYITAGTSTTIDARSNEWKYGRRTYEFENNFFSDTGTAQLVASSFVNQFSNLKSELSVDCEFLPHVELLDNLSVSYTEKPQNLSNSWDAKDWAADTTTADGANFLSWSSETSAAIQFTQKSFKIISKQTNLDTFITSLILRETEG